MCSKNTDCSVKGECCWDPGSGGALLCSSDFYGCISNDGKLENGQDCSESKQCASACCSNSGNFCTNKANECPDSSSLGSALIIGTTIAIVAALIVVVIVIICVCVKKKGRSRFPFPMVSPSAGEIPHYSAQSVNPNSISVVDSPAPPQVEGPARITTEVDEEVMRNQSSAQLSDISSHL